MPTAMLTDIDAEMSDADVQNALVKLAYWLSPAFPVGAFAYSHGLEQAIADGAIANANDTFDWICFLLEQGSARNDAIILQASLQACDDAQSLADITDLTLALASSAERQKEQLEMGRAFAAAIAQTEPLPSGLDADRCAYFVVLGALCGRRNIPAQIAVHMAMQAFVSNLVSVSQRLVPIGQTDAVALMARFEPILADLSEQVSHLSLDDLGSAALRSDMAAMKHETLGVRIFRT